MQKLPCNTPLFFGVLASPWTTLKTEKTKFACSWEMKSVAGHLKPLFVAISMTNKCAKFHGDTPRGQKVEFSLASMIELSETADFVYCFVC